jgi:hypothetical protein
LLTGESRAQLAITEVMASASMMTNDVEYPDFWELTNFGSNAVNLTGYKFYDRGDISAAKSQAFDGVWIRPNESVVFVRQDTNGFPSSEQFRQWWGLDTNAQVVAVHRDFFPGLGAAIDAIQLWTRENHLVDRVDWTDAPRGSTFVYDSATGNFPVPSEVGVCHAWLAPGTTRDVGSPGTNCGPLTLRFVAEPQDVTVDAGGPLSLSAEGAGFPRPRFQWFFEGELIEGQTATTLLIPGVDTNQAGGYFAVITNGFASITSRVAMVTVNDDPSPCELVSGLNDLTVTIGQQPTLAIVTRGYPLCTYQWYFNETEIAGATNSAFQLPPADFSHSGTYSVIWVPTRTALAGPQRH